MEELKGTITDQILNKIVNPDCYMKYDGLNLLKIEKALLAKKYSVIDIKQILAMSELAIFYGYPTWDEAFQRYLKWFDKIPKDKQQVDLEWYMHSIVETLDIDRTDPPEQWEWVDYRMMAFLKPLENRGFWF